ncbi:hypothetical protein CC86DRAFT_434578 [Ophiobolus disseminans]|uniref:Uncharacterized protein n=1 Tax=Ophiobolus disseminans TaxID=1469910 RepID=A0A6A7ABJ6_9PLEO|nr:hypothetical protein CC86DRAFT_434578 [Ophiobolus disseminans]
MHTFVPRPLGLASTNHTNDGTEPPIRQRRCAQVIWSSGHLDAVNPPSTWQHSLRTSRGQQRRVFAQTAGKLVLRALPGYCYAPIYPVSQSRPRMTATISLQSSHITLTGCWDATETSPANEALGGRDPAMAKYGPNVVMPMCYDATQMSAQVHQLTHLVLGVPWLRMV